MRTSSIKGAAILIIAIGVLGAFWLNPRTVTFWEFKQDDVTRLFTQLILVALIIERALEVLLTPWRGPDSERAATEIENLSKESSEEAKQNLQAMSAQLISFKSDTQQIAFKASLAVGVVASFLGIRAFSPLVEPNAFAKLPTLQQSAFNALDVLLTGALLSGSADGLHKILSLFLDYVDATRGRVQASK